MKKTYNKIVLAYSGGLDTSVLIPWLKENYHCAVSYTHLDVYKRQGFKQGGLCCRQQQCQWRFFLYS